MDDRDGVSEKKEVEDYLKLYAMEECLDEILNEVIIERPTNPYVAMALLCESKTLPEIIDVTFKSVIVAGELAVQANFTTNIATFTGVATYAQADPEAPKAFKDYTMLREKIRDSILDLDPVNLSKVDESISKLGIDPAESLALSIACTRAGARHKGKKLYQYIAQTVGLKEEEVCIPTPAVSVISRLLDGTQSTQDVTLTAVRASTFPSAMETLLQLASSVASAETVPKLPSYSIWGSPSITCANIGALSKMVHEIVAVNGLTQDVKLGLHMRSEFLLKQPLDPVEPDYKYFLENPSSVPPPPEDAKPKKGAPEVPQVQAKSGADVVEVLTSLWQEVEFITLSEAVYAHDAASVKTLHKRLQETAYDLKASNTEGMRYCMSGVGGDVFCPLQVPLDAAAFAEVQNVEQFAQEMPYNTVRLQLSRCASVSEAIEVVRKARTVKWPVVLESNNSTSTGRDSADTFLADFAVGVGAGQVMMGGVFTAECTAKYNRLMEITEESPGIRFAGAKFRGK